jgi:hypothetical protein
MTIRYGTQEWAVTVNGEEVVSLTDINDLETLNPTRAMFAVTLSGFIDIAPGDTFTFEYVG